MPVTWVDVAVVSDWPSTSADGTTSSDATSAPVQMTLAVRMTNPFRMRGPGSPVARRGPGGQGVGRVSEPPAQGEDAVGDRERQVANVTTSQRTPHDEVRPGAGRTSVPIPRRPRRPRTSPRRRRGWRPRSPRHYQRGLDVIDRELVRGGREVRRTEGLGEARRGHRHRFAGGELVMECLGTVSDAMRWERVPRPEDRGTRCLQRRTVAGSPTRQPRPRAAAGGRQRRPVRRTRQRIPQPAR